MEDEPDAVCIEAVREILGTLLELRDLEAIPPMPLRIRQTLKLFLAGDSEKQVAGKLGLSWHTVHVYAKTLYKLFQVNSRGELLSKFIDPRCHAALE